MSDRPARYHVSSAVVATVPSSTAAVSQEIAAFEGVEIFGQQNGKIVIVIEGASSGELGARLSQISLLDGVIAANMVFEHVEEETLGHGSETA